MIGLAARHSIYAGSVFNKTNTVSLPVIKKNQTITLAIKTGPVEIQMLGIAKSDGYSLYFKWFNCDLFILPLFLGEPN